MISQYYTLQTCVYKHTHYGMFSIFSPTLSTIHIVLKVRNPAVILNTSFPLILPHQTNHQIKSMLTYKYLSFSPHFYAHFTSLKQVSTMWITVHHLRLLLSLSPHPIHLNHSCLIFLKSHSCFLIKILVHHHLQIKIKTAFLRFSWLCTFSLPTMFYSIQITTQPSKHSPNIIWNPFLTSAIF